MNIPKSTFYRWLKDYNDSQKQKTKTVNIRVYNAMEGKIQRLKGIIEILKTAECSPRSPLQIKLHVAEELSKKYNVRMVCESLDIPRGTFYNHVLRNKRSNTWYAKRREELRIRIKEIHDEYHQIFGAGKIAAIMRNEGIQVSEEMVRQLMRDMGLISIRGTAKKLYEDDVCKHKNYINQNFNPLTPNEVWVSDITYFKFNNNAYYICVIIDLYARKVIACRISNSQRTRLVKSTFKQAYESRKPSSELIFHTDRGFNYCSKTMSDYLISLNVHHSFSRAYVPFDNAVMDSFFSSLKREELYRRKYRSEKEFRKAVDEYVIFYNTKRPHKKLNYKTPDQKEQEFALKSRDTENEE